MTGCPEVVDAATFLGMHAVGEDIRRASKAFFAHRLDSGEVLMSLEHVGWCDDVVWGYPRAAQDAYYPFMDVLHSEMAIHRVSYENADLHTALTTRRLADLPMRQRLLMGLVLSRDARLYTADPILATRRDLPVIAVSAADRSVFPEHLEQLYRESLTLRIPTNSL